MPIEPHASAADVRIGSMTASARRVHDRVEVTTRLTLHSDGHVRDLRCVVVLPPTSRVLASNPPAAPRPAFPAVGSAPGLAQPEPAHGYATFEVPSPTVGGAVDLELVTRVHEDWAAAPIAAFVYLSTPDANPWNNFAFAAAGLLSPEPPPAAPSGETRGAG